MLIDAEEAPMVDPSAAPGSTPPKAPRWVKISGLIAVLVVVAVVVVMALAGGEHGPGRHMPGGDDGGGPPVEHAP